MKAMEQKIATKFSDKKVLNNEIKKTMIANDVKSVSPNDISADGTAAPTGTVSNAIDNDEAGEKDEADSGGIIAVVVVCLILLIAAAVGVFVWYQKFNGTEEKKERNDIELPTVELFEKRGSMNSINPLENQSSVVPADQSTDHGQRGQVGQHPELFSEVQPNASMPQLPPRPQQRLNSIEAIKKGMVHKNAMQRTPRPVSLAPTNHPEAFVSSPQPPPPPMNLPGAPRPPPPPMHLPGAPPPPPPASTTKTKTKSIRFSIDTNSRQEF